MLNHIRIAHDPNQRARVDIEGSVCAAAAAAGVGAVGAAASRQAGEQVHKPAGSARVGGASSNSHKTGKATAVCLLLEADDARGTGITTGWLALWPPAWPPGRLAGRLAGSPGAWIDWLALGTGKVLANAHSIFAWSSCKLQLLLLQNNLLIAPR